MARYNLIVKPGSKREEVLETPEGLIVRVHARAHDGEANAAVIKVLADYFRVPKTSIEIISGLKSKRKVVFIS